MMIKEKQGRIFKGLSASTGISIGKAWVLNKPNIEVERRRIAASAIHSEVTRLTNAIQSAKEKVVATAKESAKNLSDGMNFILNPQIQILSDPLLINSTKERIEKNMVNAEWALKRTSEELATRFKNIKDQRFRDRVQEFTQVVSIIQQELTGTEAVRLEDIIEPVVIISHDLSPFDTAKMVATHTLGFVTEVGGKTSHTGIIASSLGIPALVAVPRITRHVKTGDVVILDAINGKLITHPSQAQFEAYNRRRQTFLYYDKKIEQEEVGLEAKTTDGVVIELNSNVESSRDIENVAKYGAKGVGLFRSEFLFMNRKGFPTEEEQFEEYKKAALGSGVNGAVIRTLDIGGDKIPWQLEGDTEANPALGLRAIRYCLANRDVFVTQLRAILRASHYGKLKIMYPMISGVEEVLRANAILAKVRRVLMAELVPFDKHIEVGMMVEIPSAAYSIQAFAKYVSFLSIGTNDLIQYLLAVDRGNEKVAPLYEPLHPAVIGTLHHVITEANRHGIDVSICGKMSSDPAYAYLLIGMGCVNNLSMEPHSIPMVKKFIRSISAKDAKKDVEHILTLGRVKDIQRYLQNRLADKLADGVTSEITSKV